jgi:hypothetical protein
MLLLLFNAVAAVAGGGGPYPGGIVKAQESRLVIEAGVWLRD